MATLFRPLLPSGRPVRSDFLFEPHRATLLAAAEHHGIAHGYPPSSSFRVRRGSSGWVCAHSSGTGVPALCPPSAAVQWCDSCRERLPAPDRDAPLLTLVEAHQGLAFLGLHPTPGAAMAFTSVVAELDSCYASGVLPRKWRPEAERLLVEGQRWRALAQRSDPELVALLAALPRLTLPKQDEDPVAEAWWVAALYGGPFEAVHAQAHWTRAWVPAPSKRPLGARSVRDRAAALAGDGPRALVALRRAHSDSCPFPNAACPFALLSRVWHAAAHPALAGAAFAAAPAAQVGALLANRVVASCVTLQPVARAAGHGDRALDLAVALSRHGDGSCLQRPSVALAVAAAMAAVPQGDQERLFEAVVALSRGWALTAGDLVSAARLLEHGTAA